jgi:hypothetical protein
MGYRNIVKNNCTIQGNHENPWKENLIRQKNIGKFFIVPYQHHLLNSGKQNLYSNVCW